MQMSRPGRFKPVLRRHTLEARAKIHRILTERTPQALLYRSLALLVLVTLITAHFSELFFWPDEHYQVLEFMSYKLGITHAADLPWEFHARVRSWMQPFLYYLIAKPLIAIGIRDLFDVTFVLRLATAGVGLAALAAFAKLLVGDFERTDEKFAYARMLPFMGFLPYLFVRTSSETLSAAFFTLGLTLAVTAVRSGSLRRLAAAGLLCGLAFECRYQSAFLSLGLLLWLTFPAGARRSQLAAFVAGAVAPIAASLPIDRWGYGSWCFPPWNYVDVDLIQGLTARLSGTAPFYAYVYILPGNIFFPIAVFLLLALVIACLRNPRHYVTWTTAPFFVAHCLLAHKEERFLFPLAILATSYPVLAFSPSSNRRFGVFGRLWPYRRSILAKTVGWSAAAAMLFLAVYPFGIRPHMKMAKYVYRHFPQGLTAYTFQETTFATYPMYRPPHYRSERLHSRAELVARLAKGPVYLFAETPTLPAQTLPAGVQASLLYSEFPLAKNPRQAPWGTQIMCKYAALRKTSPVHPPRLAWMTLYRLQYGGSPNAKGSPCVPIWNVPLE
jgi:GPI mannosyltransferase 3